MSTQRRVTTPPEIEVEVVTNSLRPDSLQTAYPIDLSGDRRREALCASRLQRILLDSSLDQHFALARQSDLILPDSGSG